MSKTSTVKTPKTPSSKTAKAASKPNPAPKPARTPKAAPKAAPKDPAHKYERASDTPCLACGAAYVHSAGLCSSCYNRARKPMAAGLKGADLVAAVQAKIAKRSSTTKPASKVAAKRTRKSSKATQPLTTVDDALGDEEDIIAANKALYGQHVEGEEVAPAF